MMPFGLEKSGSEWKVIKKTTGAAIPGASTTKSKAIARIGAIESHLHEEGKDMHREKYADSTKPTPPSYGKPTSQSFDGTPVGPLHKTDLSGSKDATPALDPPRPVEENSDMNPWQEAMKRVGPGATMRQLKAALMESPNARSWRG